MIGQVFCQRYHLIDLLGKSTGRRTFLAEDKQTGQQVVIKLVLFGPDFTWQDLKLFEREAETLKSLDHPAIPKYLDSFDVETPLGQGFALVQPYIPAKSLQAWVSGGYTFEEDGLRAIALDLLHILNYLHQRHPPVIHRDIKPSNILLPTQNSQIEGGIYLVDFGSVQTAPSSGTMTVVGTYGYMPPEQFGGRAQPASDLYSLGTTLIYLATGQHPAEFTQSSLQIELEGHVNLSPSFLQWIKQLTYADLSKRTPSATRAIYQLEHPYAKQIYTKQTYTKPAKQLLRPEPSALSPANLHVGCPPRRTRRDFKVSSTPDDFVVCFSWSRLESNLLAHADALSYKLAAPWMKNMESSQLVVLIFGMITIILIEQGWSIFLVIPIIFGLLLFLLASILWFLSSAFSFQKEAILQLTNTAEGRWNAEISQTLKKPKIEQNSEKLLKSSNTAHREVTSISASAYSFYYQITFYSGKEKTRPWLKILGSRKEIEWLCAHITHWSNIPIDYSPLHR